jgi:outer membrane biosynthesis protein TonB
VPAGNRWYAALAAFALLAATSAHADYKDTYARGLRAYEEGKYDEARTLMQQALEEHSEPVARLRLYGQVYKAYLPQHYVGMAAFKLGDCESALKHWNDAQNRGVLPIVPEAEAEEQQARPTCEGKVVAKKEEKAPNVPDTTVKPPVADSTKTTVAKTTPPPVVTPPKPPPAEKPPVEKPAPVAKNEPPQPLMQAFDDYLAGRYAEVARIDPDAYADTHARFHAYLVRAAAKYTLSRLSADEQVLNGARADARAARKLDGGTAPDATLFSPGFRTFYGETR